MACRGIFALMDYKSLVDGSELFEECPDGSLQCHALGGFAQSSIEVPAKQLEAF